MSIRKKAKKLAGRAGVALATTGLSACRFGPVDPPPPPFECTTGVVDGQTLEATATVSATVLQFKIVNRAPASWTFVRVTSVVGGTARPVGVADPLIVVIDLIDESVQSGSFKLSGTVHGYDGHSCPVTRTFKFRLGPEGVDVALAEELPLAERQSARIALLSWRGHQVELEATTPFVGDATITWAVTGGEVVSKEGTRLSWRLPAEAGLYQAQLVIDYGPHGLSFDALALEVSAANSSREESS